MRPPHTDVEVYTLYNALRGAQFAARVAAKHLDLRSRVTTRGLSPPGSSPPLLNSQAQGSDDYPNPNPNPNPNPQHEHIDADPLDLSTRAVAADAAE